MVSTIILCETGRRKRNYQIMKNIFFILIILTLCSCRSRQCFEMTSEENTFSIQDNQMAEMDATKALKKVYLQVEITFTDSSKDTILIVAHGFLCIALEGEVWVLMDGKQQVFAENVADYAILRKETSPFETN